MCAQGVESKGSGDRWIEEGVHNRDIDPKSGRCDPRVIGGAFLDQVLERACRELGVVDPGAERVEAAVHRVVAEITEPRLERPDRGCQRHDSGLQLGDVLLVAWHTQPPVCCVLQWDNRDIERINKKHPRRNLEERIQPNRRVRLPVHELAGRAMRASQDATRTRTRTRGSVDSSPVALLTHRGAQTTGSARWSARRSATGSCRGTGSTPESPDPQLCRGETKCIRPLDHPATGAT